MECVPAAYNGEFSTDVEERGVGVDAVEGRVPLRVQQTQFRIDTELVCATNRTEKAGRQGTATKHAVIHRPALYNMLFLERVTGQIRSDVTNVHVRRT